MGMKFSGLEENDLVLSNDKSKQCKKIEAYQSHST